MTLGKIRHYLNRLYLSELPPPISIDEELEVIDVDGNIYNIIMIDESSSKPQLIITIVNDRDTSRHG